MYTIEHLGDYPIEVSGVGVTKKGVKLQCNEKVARDLSGDKRFNVTGLEKKKKKGGE